MITKELSKSIRKLIRKEKSRIRRDGSGPVEQQKQVSDLELQFHKA